MKKILNVLSLLVLAFVLFACQTKIIVETDDLEVTIDVLEQYQIQVKTNDEKGLIYQSNNSDIVQVDNLGVIKGISAGTANVKAASVSNELVFVLITINVVEIKPEEPEIPEEPGQQDLLIAGTLTILASDLWENKDEEETTNILFSDNYLKVENKLEEAIYISKPIEARRFTELVLTYNLSDTNIGEAIFMVSVGDGTNFSEFMTMAIFEGGYGRSVSGQNDLYASVSIDTLNNKNTNNKFIKIKVLINSSSNLRLKNISITTKKTSSKLIYDENLLINKTLDVPRISQLNVPGIGNIICSPTSVSMVLNYYNKGVTEVNTANKVQDKRNNIYGNWTLNASYAGSFSNLTARVEYIHNFSDVISYIENDIPVIFSITTRSLSDLDGSIMAFPAGHLIVLIGFEQIDGIWYGVFNDPAEYSPNKVLKKYRLEQIFNVWKQYTYIIYEN